MFGIGGFELFLILLFGFLVFGPDKLPAIAKTIGKGIAKFRDAQEEMTSQLKKESFIDKDSDEPFKNPLDVIEKSAKNAKSGVDTAKKKADKAADAVVEAAEHVPAAAAAAKANATEHVASFAERKAKYDRERAERKAAEAAAKEAEAKEAVAKEAGTFVADDPKTDVAEKRASEVHDTHPKEGE